MLYSADARVRLAAVVMTAAVVLAQLPMVAWAASEQADAEHLLQVLRGTAFAPSELPASLQAPQLSHAELSTQSGRGEPVGSVIFETRRSEQLDDAIAYVVFRTEGEASNGFLPPAERGSRAAGFTLPVTCIADQFPTVPPIPVASCAVVTGNVGIRTTTWRTTDTERAGVLMQAAIAHLESVQRQAAEPPEQPNVPLWAVASGLAVVLATVAVILVELRAEPRRLERSNTPTGHGLSGVGTD